MSQPIVDLLKLLLLPLALVYGAITAVRNFLYDKGYFHSTEFDLPTISVGNLSVGGTGKTPHIEYLIRLLSPHLPIATLSRGYKRKSTGFRIAQAEDNALSIGDEPTQYFKKFPNITVAVGENRMLAIPSILADRPHIRCILLDDAFQHRSVRPGLNILLTEYHAPYFNDHILPYGRLREARHNADRADMIIVSKCPPRLSQQDKDSFLNQLSPKAYQKVYFSSMVYGQAYNFFDANERLDWTGQEVLLVSGIANNEDLLAYLKAQSPFVAVQQFADHHNYDRYDLENIRTTFDNMGAVEKVMITTEKDATRLEPHYDWLQQNGLPIYVLPIQVQFDAPEQAQLHRDLAFYLNTTLSDKS